MTIFSSSEARQNFASVLNKAQQEGQVLIKRKDGTTFVLKPVASDRSVLDVEGIDVNISKEEIIDILKESRST